MNLLDWIFPKGVSASGSGGNQGIMNDIFGPNGLLDYRRFTGGKDIGAWLNDSISKPIQDWWGSWSLGGIAGDIWSKLGLGNIDVGKWFSDNVTTPITDWWNSWTLAGVAGDILSKLGLGNIDVGQWFSDNVTTPITDWWNSWSIGDVTGGIMEKLGLGEDFDITQWCIDNIQTPILNWWNSWSLGGWISKLGFNNLNVNGLIQTYIVQPFLTLSGRITAPLLSTYNTIRSNITNAMNIARTTVQNGVKYVSDRWYWLVGQGRSAWSSVYNAVVPRIQWIGDKINWLRSLVGSGSIKSPGGSFANSTVGGVASAGSGGNSGVFAGAGNFDDIILKGVQSLADKWFGGNVWNIFTMGVGSNPWGAFMNFAERLFSGFHYKFYFNHRQDTLKTHEGNCWDLAEALIAVGKAFGLNGSMHHGFWGSVGHMWTTWSGHGALDPTRWVLDRVWSPPGQHQYGAIGEGYAGYGCNSSLCDPLSTLYGGYSGSSPVTTPAMRVAGLPNVSSISTFSTFVPRPTPRYPVAGGRAVVSGIGYSGTVPQSTQPVQVVRKEFIFHVHGLPEFTRRVQEIIDEEFND